MIADDHPMMLHALSDVLAENDIEVVARASTGAAAFEATREHEPDVAVLDDSMPVESGTSVATRAREAGLTTKVVLYTAHADRALLLDALEAGVRGIVLKHAAGDEIVRAVTTVAAGGSYLDPLLAGLVAETVGRASPKLPTARERQVLRLVADGLTNDEIATKLKVSGETVRTHVRRAMDKLGARSRTEAVAAALRRSLIS